MKKSFPFYICLVLWISVARSHGFSRTFKVKRNKTEKVGDGRFVNAIKRLTRIDPMPEIPDVSTLSPKGNIGDLNKDSFSFDICKSTDLCLNNGTCIANLNEYFCNCLNTHYGKTCEFKADQSKCQDNMCMNNSTCYSTKESRIVPNLKMKKNVEVTVDITISVDYECWCRHGYHGSFCEFSEATRRCVEDHCNHHGIVVPIDIATTNNPATKKNKNTEDIKCTCHCEQFYFGEQCEFINPCRDLECVNNSTCVFNNSNGTAYCQCPTEVELFRVKFQGKQCETIVITDRLSTDHCVPCNGLYNFMECLGRKSKKWLERITMHYKRDCEQCNEDHLRKGTCLNNGICQVAVGPLPGESEPLLLLPKCLCTEGFEGVLCEKKIHNECDISDSPQPRCLHGECIFNAADRSTSCVCDKGYRGPRCEQKDPCVPNPCGDALCVEFPLSDTFSDEDLKHTCICKTSQDIDETSHACRDELYRVCLNYDRSPKCENGGNCYPCELDVPELRILALCDEAEQQRKFRCVCPPGFHPPFCRENATICDAHYCQNGATCQTIPGHPLDYKCVCAPGFNGTFCHVSLGICLQKGDPVCIHGRCVADNSMHREFRCDCFEGFEGLNCELAVSWYIVSIFQDYFAFTYPFFVFVVCAFISKILVSRRRAGSENVAVPEIPTAKHDMLQ